MSPWLRRNLTIVFVVVAVVYSTLSSLLPARAADRVAIPSHPQVAATATSFYVATTACTSYYIVKRGDWLGRVFPTNWRTIAANNHLTNPNLIYPGERLCTSGPAASNGPQATLPPPLATNTTFISAVTTTPSSGIATYGEPCQSGQLWQPNISQWTVPPGCYSGVYWEGYGDCAGWVRHLHGLSNLFQPKHAAPIVGAIAVFAGGEQGASPEGHYGQVIAIQGYWMLISDENDYWRGGGYDKVIFRYVHQSPGITYIY